MAIVSKTLLKKTEFTSSNGLLLVINGEIVTYQSSQVYAKAVNGAVRYFYYEMDAETRKRYMVAIEHDYIERIVNSNNFCGIKLDVLPTNDEWNLTINISTELRIAFIETVLFTEIRKLACTPMLEERKLVFNNSEYDTFTVSRLVQAFRAASWHHYHDLVYSKIFIGKIYRSYDLKFYSTFKQYIPILIKCKYMYNPLLDNPGSSIADTRFYRELYRSHREKEILRQGELTVVLATHLEISRALNLKNMMCYTPQMLFQLLAGFLTDQVEFPNIRNIIYTSPDPVSHLSLRRTYDELQYVQQLNLARQRLEEINDENESGRSIIVERIKALGAYVKRDSLYQYLLSNRNAIIHFSGSILNMPKSVSVDAMHEYLSTATIF